jgi:hypothetical protein
MESDQHEWKLCEYMMKIFLPNLYSALGESNRYKNLMEQLNQAFHSNNSAYIQCESKLNTNCVHMNYLRDLYAYMNFCNQFESNIFYLYWLLDIFKPLLITMLTLFIFPVFIVLFLYASSLFLYITKHWSKLKVSTCLVFTSFLF